jgi:hypothetical protein
MTALRTTAIWVFGLLASVLVGGLIGAWVDAPYHSGWGPLLGALAGLSTFPCVRLWLAERRESKR